MEGDKYVQNLNFALLPPFEQIAIPWPLEHNVLFIFNFVLIVVVSSFYNHSSSFCDYATT